MDHSKWRATGVYRAVSGVEYSYTADACDSDLDHPDACLFNFIVTGPAGAFEKVIPVLPQELQDVPPETLAQAALHIAEAKLYRKLDQGNVADEPTPLR